MPAKKPKSEETKEKKVTRRPAAKKSQAAPKPPREYKPLPSITREVELKERVQTGTGWRRSMEKTQGADSDKKGSKGGRKKS